jgi:hypothetical protein
MLAMAGQKVVLGVGVGVLPKAMLLPAWVLMKLACRSCSPACIKGYQSMDESGGDI